MINNSSNIEQQKTAVYNTEEQILEEAINDFISREDLNLYNKSIKLGQQTELQSDEIEYEQEKIKYQQKMLQRMAEYSII